MLNSIAYLEECLNSVCSQSLTEIEILCVDAGSSDGTMELVNSYAKKDTRMKLIHSEVKSYGVQINIGIENAIGEYIGIVESDDYVSSRMFQNLYEKAIKFNLDFVKGGYVQFGNIGTDRFEEKSFKRDNILGQFIDLNKQPEYRLFDPVHIWTGVYKRSFLKEKNITLNNTPGASYQDTSFSILVSAFADNCIYVDDCDYYYRIDNVNSSVKSDTKSCCIADEYKYVINELNKHKNISTGFKNQIQRYKLTSYFWNYKRLSSEGKRIFLGCIASEMEEYTPLFANLTEEEKRKVYYLTGAEREKEFLELEHQKYTILKFAKELIENNKTCVCVTAGQYAKKFIQIQHIFGAKLIEAVCDNNQVEIVQDGCKYQVMTVKDAISKYSDFPYVIANKNHYEDIKNQLNSLGIEDSQIVRADSFPSFGEVIEFYKEIDWKEKTNET